ncbi:MAG: hypothetical protein HOV81_20315 [Kofleriaceae bacterium]|nr:hypothetical protein [Kofleriaceae bacterium]
MATSNYDVNVQLALATTAEHEGDFGSARTFLAEARRLARADRAANAQVGSFVARFLGRRLLAAVL